MKLTGNLQPTDSSDGSLTEKNLSKFFPQAPEGNSANIEPSIPFHILNYATLNYNPKYLDILTWSLKQLKQVYIPYLPHLLHCALTFFRIARKKRYEKSI